MEIRKTVGDTTTGVPSPADLTAINRLTKATLSADQVYIFPVRLCDNEVDRDFERFDSDALDTLGQLFVGKSGIFDHQWSADGQTARLYRTEVVEEPGVTQSGEVCCYLKGWAYMLRTEKNRDLIAEIEGGIKREVSIGCSVSRRECSICGKSDCSHQPGKTYRDKLCYMTLKDPTDAYEWSFVAVPAQRKAGVIKAYGGDLHKALQDMPLCLRQLEALEQEASLGRSYLAGLRRDVVRLAGLAEAELDLEIFSKAVDDLEEPALLELRRVWQHRIDQEMTPLPQLTVKQPEAGASEDGAFLI